MDTIAKLQIDDQAFIKGMAEYLQKLKALPQEMARQEAREALIRTGVLTKDGKSKKSIVSWE